MSVVSAGCQTDCLSAGGLQWEFALLSSLNDRRCKYTITPRAKLETTLETDRHIHPQALCVWDRERGARTKVKSGEKLEAKDRKTHWRSRGGHKRRNNKEKKGWALLKAAFVSLMKIKDFKGYHDCLENSFYYMFHSLNCVTQFPSKVSLHCVLIFSSGDSTRYVSVLFLDVHCQLHNCCLFNKTVILLVDCCSSITLKGGTMTVLQVKQKHKRKKFKWNEKWSHGLKWIQRNNKNQFAELHSINIKNTANKIFNIY